MSTGNSPPNAQNKTVSIFPVKVLDKLGGTELQSPQTFTLSTAGNGLSEVILDYGRAEGGIPFFETCSVESNGEPVLIDAIYSETSLGLTQETGQTICSASRTREKANMLQAMALFSYFQTRWIPTA